MMVNSKTVGKIWPCVMLIMTGTLFETNDAYRQEITFYESHDDGGPSHHFTTKISDSTYLSSKIVRVCAQGSWHLFKEINYGRVETGILGGGYIRCENVTFPIASFRYNGASETEEVAATLYEKFNMEGGDITITGGAYDMSVRYRSITFTGADTWTIHEGPKFDGRFECITPTATALVAYFHIPKSIGHTLAPCHKAVHQSVQIIKI